MYEKSLLFAKCDDLSKKSLLYYKSHDEKNIVCKCRDLSQNFIWYTSEKSLHFFQKCHDSNEDIFVRRMSWFEREDTIILN